MAARAFPWTGALLVAAIVAAGALALWAMGQPLICRCGSVALWSGDIWSSQNSQQAADPYSFTHVTHGILLFWGLYALRDRLPLRALAGLPGLSSLSGRLVVATAIEVGWEVVENTPFIINRYREATISLDYLGDSVLNSTGDVLCCLVGFALAARLPGRAAVALVVAIEVALALTIRDSLLLNIIMLVIPLAAIREWQVAG